MPIIRTDDKGNEFKNKKARLVALTAMVGTLAGAGLFVTGTPVSGLFVALVSNSLASIWNLYDA